MTDASGRDPVAPRGDSGVTPERSPEQRLPARRPPTTPSAERFTAPPSTHATGGLTPARAAKIVRQSADARWIAFLGVSIVSLFVIVYYFYELGAPLGLSTPRLDAQADAQQVTAIERGYNLYQANCARCHGVNGEGGVGPVLNDQMKLFDHLNEQYLRNVMTVGGRLVCGNPNSLMPVWADTNGGPLNYLQIEDLIAFIRAPNDREFEVRDPALNEPVIGEDGEVETFRGWVDPNFKPEAEATPVPACYLGDQTQSQPPSASLSPDATVLEISSENIAFDKKELEAPADTAFGIHHVNAETTPIDHDVDIRSEDGTTLVDTARIGPGETTYSIPALPAGTYTFICSVHPIPAMTGTLTVE